MRPRPQRTMRLALLATICVLALQPSQPACACQVASQLRLFPLGEARGELVAFELEVRRSDGDELASAEYNSRARLVALEGPTARRPITEWKPISAVLGADRKAFLAAVADAQRLEGFLPARLMWREDCGYLDRCNVARWFQSRRQVHLTRAGMDQPLWWSPQFPESFDERVDRDWLRERAALRLGAVALYHIGER